MQTCAAGRRSVHLRLDEALLRGIETFASHNGLGLSSAVRLLTSHALREAQSGGDRVAAAQPAVGLATLVAAELAVLMVASVLPEGERRMRELAERATQAAGERLALFQQNGDAGDERL